MLNIMRKLFSKKQVKELSKETIESEKPKLNVGWLYEDGEVTEEGETQAVIYFNLRKYFDNRCTPTFSIEYNGEQIDLKIGPSFEAIGDETLTSQGGQWYADDWDGEFLSITNDSAPIGKNLTVICVTMTNCYNSNQME